MLERNLSAIVVALESVNLVSIFESAELMLQCCGLTISQLC